MRELPRTDPEVWDRVSRSVGNDGSESDVESDDVSAGEDVAVAGPEELDDDPFADDAEYDDDSWMEPAQLFSQLLNPSSEPTGDVSGELSGPGIAEEDVIDLEAVHVPDAEEFGRGKRRRVSNKQFDGFVGH